MSYNLLRDEVLGYISHPKVMSSWMLVFLPYHANLGEVLSNALCIFHLWTSYYVSTAQHHLFSCVLMSRSPAITML